MKKVIIKIKCILKSDDLERLENQIQKDLDTKGFVVLDEKYEVYVVEE